MVSIRPQDATAVLHKLGSLEACWPRVKLVLVMYIHHVQRVNMLLQWTQNNATKSDIFATKAFTFRFLQLSAVRALRHCLNGFIMRPRYHIKIVVHDVTLCDIGPHDSSVPKNVTPVYLPVMTRFSLRPPLNVYVNVARYGMFSSFPCRWTIR